MTENRIPVGKDSERLVFAMLRYIGDCSSIQKYQELIKSNLQIVFSVLILPNISITQDDIDEFEDDPDQYIKNDLEESDSETRRRQCMKFVQQLSRRFQIEMNALIGQQINMLMQNYAQNKVQNWIQKATMLNLLITSSIGCYTYNYGASELLIESEQLF